MTKPMKRALIAFLITSAIGLIALIIVARTAWRYGDTPGGLASGKSPSRSRTARRRGMSRRASRTPA